MSGKLFRQFCCSKMMLPEHCNLLKEHCASAEWNENHRRPDHDEQLQEELQQVLDEAMAERRPLNIKYLDESGYHIYSGVPRRCDPAAGKIFFSAVSGTVCIISASEIVEIKSES